MYPVPYFIVAPASLLLIAVTLPLMLELLTLSVAAALPFRKPRQPPGSDPRLAVIIPAHNEEKLIATCVASLAAAPRIFVIAHNCADATAQRAVDAGATVFVLNDTLGGKGTALDFGFRQAMQAGAEVLLVIDADSIAGPDFIGKVSAAFAAGAQAIQCRYEVANPGANRRTRLAALGFLGMNVLRPRGRHRLGLSCGIFGNGFALSAATLAQVPYTPNSLVEDLEYHLHLIRAGIRVEFIDDATVLGEMPETSAAASTQRARWEGGRILMRRFWAKPLAVEVLRGHLRMLEPLLDLLAVPLATEAALLMITLIFGRLAQSEWLFVYALVGSLTIALYVVVAAMLGAEPGATLGALASTPGYMIWKLMMIPRTRLAARADAAWVRTARNSEPDAPKTPKVPKGPIA
jgi:cellulose synthase/poly-beta-1,6-N-acetylglucosamine synthase-like glycosyltransferase